MKTAPKPKKPMNRRKTSKGNLPPFGQLVEAVDRLSLEDREELVQILQSQIRQERHERFVEECKESLGEHAEGKSRTATVREIMALIDE